MHFPLQWFFDNLTSLEQVVQFPLMQKLDDLCVWGLWVHHVPNRLLCCVFFFFLLFHPQVVTALTDEVWRVQPRSRKPTQTHSSEGSESSWRWSPAKPAGRPTVFIFIIHTLIGTDRPHTHTRAHSHAHTSSWEKMCAGKSIFQGQPASLKIEDWETILPPLLYFPVFHFFFLLYLSAIQKIFALFFIFF